MKRSTLVSKEPEIVQLETERTKKIEKIRKIRSSTTSLIDLKENNEQPIKKSRKRKSFGDEPDNKAGFQFDIRSDIINPRKGAKEGTLN